MRRLALERKKEEEEKKMTARVLNALIPCREKRNPRNHTLLERDRLYI